MKTKSKKIILWALAFTCCALGLRAEDNRTQDPTKCNLEMHSVERMLDHVMEKKQLSLFFYECNATGAGGHLYTKYPFADIITGESKILIFGHMQFAIALKGKPIPSTKAHKLVPSPFRGDTPSERYLCLQPLINYFEDGRPSLYVVAGDDPKDILEHSFFGPFDQDPKEIAKVLKQVVALDGKPDAEWIAAARDLQGSRNLFAAYVGLAILKKKNQLKMADFMSLHDDIYKASSRNVLKSAFYLVNYGDGSLEQEMSDVLMTVFTDKEVSLGKKTFIAQAVASLFQYGSFRSSDFLQKSQLFQSTLLTLIKEDGEGSSPALIAAYKKLLSYLSSPDPQKISED